MSTKNNNKLPTNLPQLQNWIKRDAGSYHDEVRLHNGKLIKWIVQLIYYRPYWPS